MDLSNARWPLVRQIAGPDKLGRGMAVKSAGSERLRARTATADKVVKSVCPYCAVGCGQNVYVKDQKVVQIEGDPDSAVSRGRLCPKGSASLQLTTGSSRMHEVLYRRPHGTDWERLDLDTAMDRIADRVIETRRQTFEWSREGRTTRRTMGIAHLGGATLDNEENYLIKKLLTALGVVQVENQARVCHSSTVAGLGTSFGRGRSTTCMQDLRTTLPPGSTSASRPKPRRAAETRSQCKGRKTPRTGLRSGQRTGSPRQRACAVPGTWSRTAPAVRRSRRRSRSGTKRCSTPVVFSSC